MASNFRTASFRFCAWVRYSCEVTVRYPSLFIRPASFCLILDRTSAGIHRASSSRNRSSTLVLTLLTFCPPAPDDRTNDMSNLSSGMVILLGTFQSPLDEKRRRCCFCRPGGGGGWYGTYVHVGVVGSLLPSSSLEVGLAPPVLAFELEPQMAVLLPHLIDEDMLLPEMARYDLTNPR